MTDLTEPVERIQEVFFLGLSRSSVDRFRDNYPKMINLITRDCKLSNLPNLKILKYLDQNNSRYNYFERIHYLEIIQRSS